MPGTERTSLLSPVLAGVFFTTSATWEATQRLKRQESDTGWLTTPYYIHCVSSATSARHSIWGHTLIQTTPGKLVLVTDTWASQVTLVVKNLPANAGDVRKVGLIPGSGRFPGVGHGDPLQYSWLENPIDRGSTVLWWVMVHRVTKSWT